MATYKKKGVAKVTKGTKKKKTSVKKGKALKGKKKSDGAGWKNSPIVGGLCAFIIIGCLYTTFFSSPSGGGYKRDFYCTACKVFSRVGIVSKESEPYQCPECDKPELYSAMKCNDCTKITPMLPLKLDFTCSKCKHHDKIALDTLSTPHSCPECKEKSFHETYECLSCKKLFPHIRPTEEQIKAQMEAAEDPSMFMGDENSSPCPSCKDPYTQSYNQEVEHNCVHCESMNLSEITPYVVLKKEMGRKLTTKEEKMYEKWEASQ